MKNNLITAGLTVIMTLTLSSCGKKAKDHKANLEPETVTEGAVVNLVEETHKELEAAILAGDSVKFKRLLDTQKQVNLDIILPSGETLLTTATAKNNTQVVQYLIDANANVLKTNKKNETSVMIAAKLGHETMVQLLMILKGKLDTKNNDGNTALHLAILAGKEDVAVFLVNSKANYEITNNLDQTALSLATSFDQKKVIDAIKREMYRDDTLPTVQLFEDVLTNGTDTLLRDYLRNYKDKGLLTNYPTLNFYDIIIRNQKHDMAQKMMDILITEKVSVDGPEGALVTPLISSIKKDNEKFVLLFLSNNAKVNTIDYTGRTALIWAIHGNNPAIVKHLTDKDANQKYNYFIDGKKHTMKACDEARTVRSSAKTDEEKKNIEEIMDRLNCGLRWLF